MPDSITKLSVVYVLKTARLNKKMQVNHPICAFCDIQSFKTQIITENGSFYAIHSRWPLSKGHSMIIPKSHLSSGIGIDPVDGTSFVNIVNSMVAALRSTFGCSGFNIFANFGEKAGQEIPHAHFHIVPRYESETRSPFSIFNDPEQRKNILQISPEQMQNEIEKIQVSLRQIQ